MSLEKAVGPTYLVSISVHRVSKYLAVWESANLLGGKRLDKQTFDELGWVSTIVFEFEVEFELLEKFEKVLTRLYGADISLTIRRDKRAVLPI